MTVVDFGLSRCRLADNAIAHAEMTEDLFMGVGEQWDVYRKMREATGGAWQGFHPVSNALVSQADDLSMPFLTSYSLSGFTISANIFCSRPQRSGNREPVGVHLEKARPCHHSTPPTSSAEWPRLNESHTRS